MKFILLIFSFFISLTAIGQSDEQYICSEYNNVTAYYLIKRTIVKTDGYVGGWIRKRAPTEDKVIPFRDQVIDYRWSRKLPIKGYSMYRYSLTQYKIDCHRQLMKILSSLDYTEDGSILDRDDFLDIDEWVPIVPESLGESYMKCFCSYKEKDIPLPNKRDK